MTKLCPTCGKLFSSDDQFCDLDGEPLAAAENPASFWKRYWPLGAAACVFLTLVILAPGWLSDYIRNNVEITVDLVGLLSQDGSSGHLSVPLTVANKSSLPFTVESVEVQATLLGADVASARSTQKAVAPAGGAAKINLDLDTNFLDLQAKASRTEHQEGSSMAGSTSLTSKAIVSLWGFKTELDHNVDAANLPSRGRILSWLKLESRSVMSKPEEAAPAPSEKKKPAPTGTKNDGTVIELPKAGTGKTRP